MYSITILKSYGITVPVFTLCNFVANYKSTTYIIFSVRVDIPIPYWVYHLYLFNIYWFIWLLSCFMTWYVFRSKICDNIICYLKNHCPQIYVFLKPRILLNLPKLIPMDVKDPSVFVLFVCYISQIILNSLSIVNHTLAPNSERKRCILFFISKGSCTNIISSFRLHKFFKFTRILLC